MMEQRRLETSKEIALKPVEKIDVYLKFGFAITETQKMVCPRCRHILGAGPSYQCRYCDWCGQRVTFEEIEWKEDRHLGYAEGREYESIADRMV